jgi:type IV secretory pathway protease TraF
VNGVDATANQDNTLTLTFDANKTIVAVFKLNTATLNPVSVSSTELSVYPNPVTNGKLTIKNPVDNAAIIYDLNGHILKSIQLIAESNEINVNNLPKGTYLLKTGKQSVKFTTK